MLKIHVINWPPYRYSYLTIDILRKYIDQDIRFTKKNPDIVLVSTHGDKSEIINYLKPHDCVSIFFNGESTKHSHRSDYDDYLLDHVDISLGFKYLDHPNYLRFPIWLWYPLPDKYLIDKLGNNNSDFEESANFKFLDLKKKFCCIMSSHDMNKTRVGIFDRLNLYQQVDSGGGWNRNINVDNKWKIKSYNPILMLLKKYLKILQKYRNLFNRLIIEKFYLDFIKISKKPFSSENKYSWIKNYRFNICCENILDPGYVTEKLFEALFAGCIPIYLVKNQDDLIEPEVFNQDVIIKFTLDNIEEAAEKIIHLDQNPRAYQQFVSQKIFTDNAREHISNKYESLIKKIKSALKEKRS